MRSVIVSRFGGPEVLEMREAPIPEPGPGEVRIKVRAAGVNYADIMQRLGLYPDGPQPPFGAGFEVAGEIDAAGDGVEDWAPGMGAAALCSDGYSEYVTVAAGSLIPKPERWSWHQTAALPCQGLTAYHALFSLGNLSADQTVLIQAAAGGLGSMMVQMARNAWATVIGACGSVEKCALLRELGCEHPVNYGEEDLFESVAAITEGRGCDLVIESIGGEIFDKSLACVAPRGTLVTLGLASGEMPAPLNPIELLTRNIAVAGFHLFEYARDPVAMAYALNDLDHWIESDALNVLARHSFPLEEAAQAHAFVAGRRSAGKVVLIP